ncbi:MAG: response regulator [Blastocatellia bacterium]|nr:response regulator [Blastocatellia bacterium]
MAIFDKVWQQVNSKVDQAKINKEIDRLRSAIAAKPNDTELVRQLGTLYETCGMNEEASQQYLYLARLQVKSRQPQVAIAYFRKAEKLSSNEQQASILKDIEKVQHEEGQFEEAYKTARQVIEIYLSINQKEAARGFVHSLPAYGDKDAIYRKELREMIGEKDEGWAQGAKGSWVEDNSPKAMQLIATLPGYPAAKIPSVSRADKAMFSNMNVLIVDDDPGVCKLLSTALRALGCQAFTATDGTEGLKTAFDMKDRLHLIISDLLMPKMDGSQFFDELQQDPELAAIPFVCLTSRGQEEEKLAAFQKGVEDYWVKPFIISEILMRARKILQRQYKAIFGNQPVVEAQVELSGNLADLTLSQVLRILESRAKTGVLTLQNGSERATITLNTGKLHDAVYADKRAEEAVYALLYWTEGSFSFISQGITSTATIRMSIDEIFAALTRAYEDSLLLNRLPSEDSILQFSSAFYEAVGQTQVDPGTSILVSLFDGRRPLRDCLASLRSNSSALERLVQLYEHGYMVVIGRA